MAAQPSTPVVYIHGIGKQAPPDDLKLEWDLALFGRDLGDRSRMAYWADILHPAEEPMPSIAAMRAEDSSELHLEAALERAGLDPGDPRVEILAEVLLEHAGVPVRSVPAVGKRVLPLPAFMRKPIARRFLESFVADTAAYFFRTDVRNEARRRLLAALPVDEPFTLVSHSQGTVIAYEVLATLDADVRVNEWVTLGSPLGIQEVQDFLEPPGNRVPECVLGGKWHNFADPLDPVALDKGLTSDFDPRGFVQDELVVNARSRRLMDFNPHSAVGYLAHPDVRRVVHDALRLDTMSRFVLARDVAESLAAVPDARHPVLIEMLEPGYSALGEKPEETRAIEADEGPAITLELRIARAAEALEAIVDDPEAARIDPLKRFVAARLTAPELCAVAASHQDMRVYAVWRSSRKAKLTARSMRVLKADAALASFDATGDGITWAVLDTGVRGDHPHFAAAGTVKAVWDCTGRGKPVAVPVPRARDPDGHGTHVAGIIAGRAPEGFKERGAAPQAKLVVYKVLDDRGQGEDAWIIKALDHIAEQNENTGGGLAIHGLNLSLGGPFDATVYGCGFSPICMELRRLWRSGVLVVVASGNEGQLAVDTPEGEYDIYAQMSIGDPANLEDCIAVGSVHSDQPHLYGVSYFSSRGPTADGRGKPDVIAPGERISSCNSRWRAGGDNLYFADSGTSMAAPHVSGVLAAFLSVRKEFRGRPDEVKKVLLDTCVDIGRDRYHQGRGIPNLMQMLLTV
jgi:subtilisin family serine protease/pimeloyl-ACP methyl ester carboxylesterase